MSIMSHAKSMAAAIIANQDETPPIKLREAAVTTRKKTKTVGPDTQIRVSVNNPARIIAEDNPGGIEELVVISPSSNFAVLIESGGRARLNKTWTELSRIGSQAKDIAAFEDADGNYILNIKDYRWQQDIVLTLKSTSGNFIFNQVYANWYIYGEETPGGRLRWANRL